MKKVLHILAVLLVAFVLLLLGVEFIELERQGSRLPVRDAHARVGTGFIVDGYSSSHVLDDSGGAVVGELNAADGHGSPLTGHSTDDIGKYILVGYTEHGSVEEVEEDENIEAGLAPLVGHSESRSTDGLLPVHSSRLELLLAERHAAAAVVFALARIGEVVDAAPEEVRPQWNGTRAGAALVERLRTAAARVRGHSQRDEGGRWSTPADWSSRAVDAGDWSPPAATVVVACDPRTVAAECVKGGEHSRERCMEEMAAYGDGMEQLFEAGRVHSLPLPLQTSMSGVATHRAHHSLVCSRASQQPAERGRKLTVTGDGGGGESEHEPQRGPESEAEHESEGEWSVAEAVHGVVARSMERGGACVLVLDADDALSFQAYTAASLLGYVHASCRAEVAGEEGHDAPGAIDVLRERTVQVCEHVREHAAAIPPLVTALGQYGAFHEVLSELEADEVWEHREGYTRARWQWMLGSGLAVEPRDIVWGTVLFIPREISKRRGDYTLYARGLLQSLRLFGGRLNQARAILVCAHEERKERMCDRLRSITDEYGATTVSRPYPREHGGRVQTPGEGHLMKTLFFALPELQHARAGIFIDLDVLILGDLTRTMLSPRHLRMSQGASSGARSIDEFSEGWAIHGFASPPKKLMTAADRTRVYWFANSGVIMCPAQVCRAIGSELAERAAADVEAGGHWHGRDQILFAVAYYRLQPPFLWLPQSANFQHEAAKEACTTGLGGHPLLLHHYKAWVHRSTQLPLLEPIAGSCRLKAEFDALVPLYLELVANNTVHAAMAEVCRGAWHTCGTMREEALQHSTPQRLRLTFS